MIQIDHMKLFDRELGERFIEFSGIDATTTWWLPLMVFALVFISSWGYTFTSFDNS